MRLVMMGNGPFAVPTLRRLVASGHDVPLVIVRPERGKPGKAPPSPVRVAAEELHLPVAAPESTNTDEGRAVLAGAEPELLVVCDFGEILSRPTLGVPRWGGINLHGSLLPKYRGAAPVQWTVLNGDAFAGVSVIHMTPRLDGGPILATRTTYVGPDETAGDLEARLAELGVPAVEEALDRLATWDGVAALGKPQDPAAVTKAPRLTKADGAIDWNRTARQIHDQVRGLNPWPRAYTEWARADGLPLRLILESTQPQATDPADAARPDAPAPGTVVSTDVGRIKVATGHGRLDILTVQPAGKRIMEAAEFLRGYPLAVGDRFGTS